MELSKEVLKGNIDTIILSILKNKSSYGYEIGKIVKEKSKFDLKDSTMYVSLKRLESKGYIHSYWGNENINSARRKYYSLTTNGEIELKRKYQEWIIIQDLMNIFLKKEGQ